MKDAIRGLDTFYMRLILLFLILSGIVFILQNKTSYIHDHIWVIQFFFLFSTLLSYFIAAWGIKKMPDSSMLFNLGSMVFRFLLCIFFVLIGLFLIKSGQVMFSVNFFVLYLIYTWFEIYYLLRNLRPDLKNDGKAA
jgi:hypothetical protein